MAEKIVVSVKRNDRIEGIVAYVKQVTQPGMKVVFLMPVHDSKSNCWRNRRISMEAEKQRQLAMDLAFDHPWAHKASLGQKGHVEICEYCWESQRRLYEETIFPLCESLRKKGCEISIALYMGSLRKTLRYYALGKDTGLIMVRGGIDLWVTRFMEKTISIFSSFKRSECAPMLLLRPNRT